MYYKYHKYNLYYEKHGNSENNIIILPGWGNTRNTFYKLIDLLKKKYTVYIFDYPGFGNSPIINKDLTIYDYADIVNSFIKDNNINNINLVAHSFGGRISSILLGKYNININKLILIDVAGIKRIKIKVLIKRYIYKLKKLLINIFPREKRYKIRKKLLNKYSSKDYLTLPINMHNTFKNIIKENLYKYYKKINIPTLIIWGEKDLDTPLKDAKKLKKIIKKSKLIIYNNSNHFSYLNNIDKTFEIINNFIKKED